MSNPNKEGDGKVAFSTLKSFWSGQENSAPPTKEIAKTPKSELGRGLKWAEVRSNDLPKMSKGSSTTKVLTKPDPQLAPPPDECDEPNEIHTQVSEKLTNSYPDAGLAGVGNEIPKDRGSTLGEGDDVEPRIHEVVDREDFDHQLEKAGSRLVLVDFYATWCGPCKMMSPIFTKMSMESQYSQVVFLKVDVDECEDVAAICCISSMPTFVVFRNCQRLNDMVGTNESVLRQLLGGVL